jgi:hypothetical protein
VRASQAGNSTYAAATPISANIDLQLGLQDGLSVTSTSGTFGQALTLTTSGGSGTGAVTYVATNGTASGCSAIGASLTTLSAGTCVVVATKAANDVYQIRSSSDTTVTIAKGNQTISFPALSDIGIGKVSRDITASTSATGLEVVLTSNSSSYCTINGTMITFVAAGTCSITASQSGNSDFNPAQDVTRSFTINAKDTPAFVQSEVTSFQNIFANKRLGDSPITMPTLNARHSNSNVAGTLTYAMNGNQTLQFSGQTATIVRGGPSNICVTFTPTDTVSFNSETACVAVIIQSIDQTTPVVLESQTAPTSIGTGYQLEPSGGDGTGSYRYEVEFQNPTDPSNPMCQVIGGLVVAGNPGTCRVRAVKNSDDSYRASTPSTFVSFTFIKASQTLSFSLDSLLQYSADDIGERVELDGLGTAGSGLEVTYTSNTIDVCTVTATGLRIVSGGTCSITASQAGNHSFLPATSVTDTIVIDRVSQVTPVEVTSLTTALGTPLQLAAIGGDGNGELAFSVSNGISSGCAIVSGRLVASTPGTCLVTAQRLASTNYLAHSSMTTAVEITKTPQTISFNLASIGSRFTDDPAFSIRGIATSTSGLEVDLVSLTPLICTYVNGDVQPVSAGTCRISANQAGTDLIDVANEVVGTVSINLRPRTLESESTISISLPVGLTSQSGPGFPARLKRGKSVKFGMTAPSGLPLRVTTVGTCRTTAITKRATVQVKVGNKIRKKRIKVQTGWNVRGTKKGTCTITFSNAGDATRSPLASAGTITVF